MSPRTGLRDHLDLRTLLAKGLPVNVVSLQASAPFPWLTDASPCSFDMPLSRLARDENAGTVMPRECGAKQRSVSCGASAARM